MRKLVVALVAIAVIVPATQAGAKPPASGSANQACHQLRHDLGTATFRQTYGTNHNRANAMGKCRSAERHAVKQDHASAATACKAERATDPAAFTAKYGTGKHGRNALGKCISQTAQANAGARHDATENAARGCRTERASDPDAFTAKYGTGKHGRNAFGKCVRSHAKAGDA